MRRPDIATTVGQPGGPARMPVATLPIPEPRAGEIVVEVQAASVNPIDVRRRAGFGRRLLSLLGAGRLPLVLRNDFIGTVYAAGRGVTNLRKGDPVYGAIPQSSRGTDATHVVLKATHAAPRPAALDASALAALPHNYLTVVRAFDGAGISRRSVSGREVLVHGAGGGLGRIAVVLLRRLGASVTTTGALSGAAPVQLAGLPQHFAATLNFASWDDEPAVLRLLADDAVGHATTVHPKRGLLHRLRLARSKLAALQDRRRMAARALPGASYAWTAFRADRDSLSLLGESAPMLLPPLVETYRLARIAEARRRVK